MSLLYWEQGHFYNHLILLLWWCYAEHLLKFIGILHADSYSFSKTCLLALFNEPCLSVRPILLGKECVFYHFIVIRCKKYLDHRPHSGMKIVSYDGNWYDCIVHFCNFLAMHAIVYILRFLV